LQGFGDVVISEATSSLVIGTWLCATIRIHRKEQATMHFDDPVIVTIPPAVLGF
jgi:hypothetical protein